jgi:hypothetical protein
MSTIKYEPDKTAFQEVLALFEQIISVGEYSITMTNVDVDKKTFILKQEGLGFELFITINYYGGDDFIVVRFYTLKTTKMRIILKIGRTTDTKHEVGFIIRWFIEGNKFQLHHSGKNSADLLFNGFLMKNIPYNLKNGSSIIDVLFPTSFIRERKLKALT